MQIYVGRGNEQYGPYSLEEVNAYLANGTLLVTDEAWQEGMVDWVSIIQIPGVVMPRGSPPPRRAPVEESSVPAQHTEGVSASASRPGNKIALGVSNFLGGVGQFFGLLTGLLFVYALFIAVDDDEKEMSAMVMFGAAIASGLFHILAFLVRKLFV